MNIREDRKRLRMKKIEALINNVKAQGNDPYLNKDKIVNWLVFNEAITRRLALEEFDAVINNIEPIQPENEQEKAD